MNRSDNLEMRESTHDAARFIDDARLRVPPKVVAPPVGEALRPERGRRTPVFERSYHYQSLPVRCAFRAVDLLGETFVRNTRERPPAIRRVLLMRPDHIGDLVCTLPAIRAIRDSLPDAQIDLLIRSSARSLFREFDEELAGVDFLVFNASWRDRPKRKKFGFRSMRRLRRLLRLRAEEIDGPYDLAVDFAGDFQSIITARLAGVRYLVGRGIRGFGFGLDVEVEEFPKRHQVEFYQD